MKYFVYFILLIMLLALNIEAARLFDSPWVRFNLLLFPAVFAALEKKKEFLVLGFVGGLLQDFYGAAPFGSFLLSYVISVSLIYLIVKTFWAYELSWKTEALFVVVSYSLAQALFYFFAIFLPSGKIVFSGPNLSQTLFIVLLGAVLHLLSTLPVYAIWRFISNKIEIYEKKSVFN